MLIYKSSAEVFASDIRENILTDKMAEGFLTLFGRRPGQSEVNSWQNSLPRVKDLIEIADLKDINVALEYEVPYNQNRIDCLLFGKDERDEDNVVLIELKQWTNVQALEDEGNFVETYTGGNTRIVPHPSQQVKGYDGYLKSFVAEFEVEQPLVLFSCAYCHNYQKEEGEGLFAPIYQDVVRDFPIYSKNDTRLLAEKIKSLLIKGDGFEVFNRFMQSPIIPSKKLLENVSKIISNEAVFSLLNEQLVAKNIILSKVRKNKGQKAVIIVHGGPGTGKSVIAVNILAEAARKGLKVFYGCKSKPFISGLVNLVGTEGEKLFSNLYRFLPSKIKENELDVLLIDEAHRIEKSSNFQYTKKEDRTDMPQIEQLIRCSKTSVFFIDDNQNVRSQEIGHTQLIKEIARSYNCSIDEVVLNTQFRCMGSNNYIEWLESVLGYTQDEKILAKSEIFDFKIFNTPQELYDVIKEKEHEKPNSARIVAGYCWPWSDPNPDGTLVNDVVIGDFAMPWEAKEGFKLTKGTPKWFEWAYKTRGVEQVGCIYTAQGFEFDYIGVIIGNDLIYNPATDRLECDINATSDVTLRRSSENFEKYAKNIYRVLLSRGMRGCYVYFVNEHTRKFFESRLEGSYVPMDPVTVEDVLLSSKVETIGVPLVGSVPCGTPLLAEENVEEMIPVEKKKLQSGAQYFILRANGDSMDDAKIKIKDGDLILCKQKVTARENELVVALIDGEATVKEFHREGDAIILNPRSTNLVHQPRYFTEGEDFKIQGIVQEVIKLF